MTTKGTPENQYTLRAFKDDVPRVDRIKAVLAEQQVIAPKDGDVLRTIFHEGILALNKRLGIEAAPLSPPPPPPPPEPT